METLLLFVLLALSQTLLSSATVNLTAVEQSVQEVGLSVHALLSRPFRPENVKG